MSEFSLSKLSWECGREAGPMESCYKLFSWINHTLLMLLVQILWKMSQISDYFKEKSAEERELEKSQAFSPLTKELKLKRHIRSMSDVHCSTPYRLSFRSRKGSAHTLMYDSDTRAKRIMSYNRLKQLDSSDSSDCADTRKIKSKSIEHNIIKHTDSMRIL